MRCSADTSTVPVAAYAPERVRPDCSTKAAMRPTAVRVAEAMARPLPVAAVVLPRESSLSVRERTSGSRCAISAMPPALSATGPYASVARVMPRVDSRPTAEMATPYWPESALHATIVMPMVKAGTETDIMPTPRPLMMTGAGPYSAAAEMLRVGANSARGWGRGRERAGMGKSEHGEKRKRRVMSSRDSPHPNSCAPRDMLQLHPRSPTAGGRTHRRPCSTR